MPRPRRFVAGSVLGLLALCLLAACRPWGRGRDAAGCIVGENLVGGITEPAALERVIPVRKKAWEARLGGERAARPSVRARLVGWPAPAPRVDGRALPADDNAFAWQVARDTWRGLDALTDRENHFPVDNVRLAPLDPHAPPPSATTPASPHRPLLIDVVAATELGFLCRDEAVARLPPSSTRSTASRATRGFLYNYYDTTSLERTSNFVSFVDSSWLTAGAHGRAHELPGAARALHAADHADGYRFFYDAAAQLMSHGYYVNPGGAVALPLRRPVHRIAARQPDRHRQGRRARVRTGSICCAPCPPTATGKPSRRTAPRRRPCSATSSPPATTSGATRAMCPRGAAACSKR